MSDSTDGRYEFSARICRVSCGNGVAAHDDVRWRRANVGRGTKAARNIEDNSDAYCPESVGVGRVIAQGDRPGQGTRFLPRPAPRRGYARRAASAGVESLLRV